MSALDELDTPALALTCIEIVKSSGSTPGPVWHTRRILDRINNLRRDRDGRSDPGAHRGLIHSDAEESPG
jgi:hypothetical protein